MIIVQEKRMGNNETSKHFPNTCLVNNQAIQSEFSGDSSKQGQEKENNRRKVLNSNSLLLTFMVKIEK